MRSRSRHWRGVRRPGRQPVWQLWTGRYQGRASAPRQVTDLTGELDDPVAGGVPLGGRVGEPRTQLGLRGLGRLADLSQLGLQGLFALASAVALGGQLPLRVSRRRPGPRPRPRGPGRRAARASAAAWLAAAPPRGTGPPARPRRRRCPWRGGRRRARCPVPDSGRRSAARPRRARRAALARRGAPRRGRPRPAPAARRRPTRPAARRRRPARPPGRGRWPPRPPGGRRRPSPWRRRRRGWAPSRSCAGRVGVQGPCSAARRASSRSVCAAATALAASARTCATCRSTPAGDSSACRASESVSTTWSSRSTTSQVRAICPVSPGAPRWRIRALRDAFWHSPSLSRQ